MWSFKSLIICLLIVALPFNQIADCVPAFLHNRSLTNFEHFPRYVEIESYLKTIQEENPDFIKLTSLTTTYEGRNVYLLEIYPPTASDNTRAVFIDAGIHAREWIAVSTGLFIINSLVELFRQEKMSNTYDSRAQVKYYILPLLNPDGYEFSHTDNRMWRKNRKNPPAGSQCYGIDLNRNYDVVGFGIGASEDPCSDSYSGKKARSEPEVIAASDVVMQHSNHIRVSLSLHSYGQKWLTSWGYTTQRALDNDKLIDFGLRVTKDIAAVHGRKYDVETAAGLYPAGGASDDFAKAKAHIPFAVTLELPPTHSYESQGFQISPSKIKSVGEEIWAGLQEVASTASKEPLGPDRSALMEEKLRRQE